MKKVLFYTQNRWAYGSIHHALCKELYKYNIYANVLDWTQTYTSEEFELLNNTYDLFVTNPEAVLHLHYNYGIPLNRIIAIAHGQWDILLAKKEANIDFYPELHSYAVIAQVLKDKSEEFNISVIPKVIKYGIHFDVFYRSINKSLKNIGYGGAKEMLNFFGEEIKRGHLVEKVVSGIADLNLVSHNYYNHLCMPGYYNKIDALIMSSTEEAGGTPVMEASASGKLIIGTPVGYFKEDGKHGGGILVPLDELGFLNETRKNLLYYRDNPKQYREKCEEIQQYAREQYDWSKRIDSWVELFS
jgi:glycosyltransferase involved in cell wall biosynthesis